MSLSKPLTLRHLCHLLNSILGLFYHRHIVFLTISLVKNTKCYLPKKSAPAEWPRNKLLATTCFFHSETNIKKLAAQPGIDPRPSGFKHQSTRVPPLHHRDFSILRNPSFSLLSELTLGLFKGLGAQVGNRFSFLRVWAPQPWPLHHHGKGWTPLVFLLNLILFFHSETDWKKKLVVQPEIEPGPLI